MGEWQSTLTAAGTLLIGLAGGWFTRRSAKESNAGQLYGTLTGHQREELVRLFGRVAALEADQDQVREANRLHSVWDRTMTKRLREALPDEEFPDPPPLDT